MIIIINGCDMITRKRRVGGVGAVCAAMEEGEGVSSWGVV